MLGASTGIVDRGWWERHCEASVKAEVGVGMMELKYNLRFLL
jgi:hypothetical protein